VNPNSLIRKTALEVLAQYKNGIRQSDLIRKVEDTVKVNILLSEHTVRNAVWDLQDKYPDAVFKKKISHRNVLLFPTDALVEKYGSDLPYDIKFLDTSDVEIAAGAEDLALISHTGALQYRLLDIFRYVEMSQIDSSVEEIFTNYHQKLSPNEVEQLLKLKTALREIREVRNYVAHFGFGSIAGDEDTED